MIKGNLTKEKKERILAVVLIFMLVLLLFWNFNRKKRLQEKAIAPTPAIATAPLAPSGQAPPVNALEKYTKELAWKRDPFVLEAIGDGRTPTLQLKVSGIIYDEIRPEGTYAIINEEVVRIGDSLYGIKVIDIQPRHVRLKKLNEEILLHLYEEGGKKE